uniref:Uncharacterized protein n=1 Tax=viral metagenome TaxID=1070528 RepID=A0A6M3JWF6_9ZZZZ
MPLSKERDRERKRVAKLRQFQPKVIKRAYCPTQHLISHLLEYPEYLVRLENGTYDPKLDPGCNPLMRVFQPNLAVDFGYPDSVVVQPILEGW